MTLQKGVDYSGLSKEVSQQYLLEMSTDVTMNMVTPPQSLLAGVASNVQSGAEPFHSLLGNWSPGTTLSIHEEQYVNSEEFINQGCYAPLFFCTNYLPAIPDSPIRIYPGANMSDWNSVITEALNELQADTTFTRGAILRDRVNQICRRGGLDFDSFLKETNQKFSSVVEQVDDVEIHKRPNTDMYVGLKGAKWPESTEEPSRWNRSRIREDVYEAFTRISDSDYWYLPDTDEFKQDIAKDDPRRKIAVPSVTLESLLNQRRQFAEKSDAHEALTKAIERSPNPLAAFQAEVTRQRLGREWHSYKSEELTQFIQEWAEKNGIEFRPQWMESPEMGQNPQSPQKLMANFAAYMTDEEIRSMSVPFRAVEAMYRSISNSRG